MLTPIAHLRRVALVYMKGRKRKAVGRKQNAVNRKQRPSLLIKVFSQPL